MAHNRYIPLLLALTLTLQLPLVPAATPADVSPVAVVARTSEGFATIQEALDAAAVGDTVTVIMSSATPPVAYTETLTLSKDGVTLCATVAHGVCSATSVPARWNLSASSWGTPPVAWQGQAILVNAVGSTSYYATSQQPGAPKMYVSDINALSFDFLLASGSCSGGGVRFQFGLDSNGDGVKDKTIFAYPIAPCSAGKWVVSNVIASGTWGLGSIGGASSGATKAQADTLSAGMPIISANLVFDGAPPGTIGWFDNEQINGAFLREQVDETCPDAYSPSCVTVSARPATTITSGGATVPTVTITGNGVTLRDLTIKNPDISSAAHRVSAVHASGSNVKILGNDIAGNGPRPVLSTRDSPEFGIFAAGANFEIANNSVTDWAHTGIYVSAGPGLVADNLVNVNRQNALYLEDAGPAITIVRNDLTQSQGANIRVDGRAFELHENVLGVAQYTLDYNSAAAPPVNAQRNDWGAYTREDIEATIHEDAPGHSTDVSCYYDAVGAPICPASPDFTFVLTGPQWNDPVQFTDSSTAGGNPIDSYSWNFGDGSPTSAQTSPSHVFANSGTFPVTLTLTDDEGFTSSITKSVGVANTAPLLAAVASVTTPEGSLVSFALSATDADGDAITYSGIGLPAGASVNPTTGAFSWTPSFAQAGSYSIAFRASDGDLYAQQTATISVTNVDRAPVLAAIGDRTVLEAASISVAFTATDADGDAVVLSASGVPSWATFDATARTITGSPTVGDRGNYPVTITATAASLSDSETFTLKVVPAAAIQLSIVGASNLHASPGEVVPLTATITNGGATTDTFSFSVASARAWGRVVPANVTLAAGQSATVTVNVVAPSASERSTITWTATSASNPTVTRSVSWSVDVPVILTYVMESASVVDGVRGTVKATWLDGSVGVGLPIRMIQSSQDFTNFVSEINGVTDANGEFAFSFEDIGAAFPGTHDLTIIHAGLLSSRIQTTYDASVA